MNESSQKIENFHKSQRNFELRLKMIQDVKTRWNFICLMLLRALHLQVFIKSYISTHENENTTLQKLSLNNEEWTHVQYLVELLKSFAIFTDLLERNRELSINAIYIVYNVLFFHIKDHMTALKRKQRSWKCSLLKVLTQAWIKLFEYYADVSHDRKLMYNLKNIINFHQKLNLYKRSTWQDSDYKQRYKREFINYYARHYAFDSTTLQDQLQERVLQQISFIADIVARRNFRRHNLSSLVSTNEAKQYLNQN